MSPSASVVTAPEERLEASWLDEVLETVAEFGEASIGLVAWEFCLPEEALAPAWRHAIAERLIEEAGRCPETAERMYRLVPFADPSRRRPVSGLASSAPPSPAASRVE